MALAEVFTVDPITDKDQSIPQDLWTPSHSDTRFNNIAPGGLTVFCDPQVALKVTAMGAQMCEGLRYIYHDRLEDQVGLQETRRAEESAAQGVGANNTARFAEAMLRLALTNPGIWLGHIRTGVHEGNGHPYRVYGFKWY